MLCLIIIQLIATVSLIANPDLISSNVTERQEYLPKDYDVSPFVPSTPQESIDYTAEYQGGTVQTVTSFNKEIFNPATLEYFVVDNIDVNPYIVEAETIVYNKYELYDDDEGVATFQADIDPDLINIGSATYLYIYMDIYCGGEGTLYYEGYGQWYYTASTKKDSDEISGTWAVSQDYLDNKGYLHLIIEVIASDVQDRLIFVLKALRTANEDEAIIDYSYGSGVTDDDVYELCAQIDTLYFQRTALTNQLKSTYQYTAPTTTLHTVVIPSVYATQHLLYTPLDWEYASINPIASVSAVGDNWKISNPIETTYTVKFVSISQNKLALKDVSKECLTDVGFEDGTINDLSNVIISPFDNYIVSTDIVSEGHRSLKGVDTEASYDVFSFNIDYRGGLYFSFDYYLLTGYTWADMQIYYRIDDSTWDYDVIAFESSERWNKVFVHFELLGWEESNNRNVVIQFASGQGTIYIDNLRFFIPSTTIETLEPSKYQIESTLIAWDGYQNPIIPNEEVHFKLYDRTDSFSMDALMFETSIITNFQGIASFVYDWSLDQKEYLLMAYCPTSYFSVNKDTKEDYADLSNWSILGSDYTSYSEAYDSDTNELTFVIRDDDTTMYFQYDSNDFDEQDDILYFEPKINASEDIFIRYTYPTPYDGNYLGNITDQPIDSTYRTITDYLNYYEFSSGIRTTDFTMPYLRFGLTVVVDTFYEFKIKDFHFINTQKLYFTPSYAYHTDYFEVEEGDACDFSEGDFELTLDTYATTNESVANGYYFSQIDMAVYNALLLSENDFDVSIDCSYYTHLLFRAKMDDWSDGGNRWEFTVYEGGTPYDTEFYYTDYIYPTDSEYGEWVTWLVDLRTTTNFRAGYQWGVDFTTLDKIQIYHTGGQAHEGTEDLSIDYIALVHVDSWLEKTNDYATDLLFNAWDFDEGGAESDITTSGMSSTTYESGNLIAIADSDWDRVIIENINTNTGYYNTLFYRIWSDTSVSAGNFYVNYRDASSNIGYDYTTYLTANEWTIFSLTIDSSFVNNLEIIYLQFEDDWNTYPVKIKIDYIRIIHKEAIPYLTFQNSYYLESDNNDLVYDIWVDYNFIGTFSDYSLIPFNNTIGEHIVMVSPYKQDTSYLCPMFVFYYNGVEGVFSIDLQSHYLTDSYVNTFFNPNQAGTYYVYENDPSHTSVSYSGSFSDEFTTISTNRDTTAGATILYDIKFVSDVTGEETWFKSSYQNAASPFYLTHIAFAIDDTDVTFYWNTSISQDYAETELEDAWDFEEGDVEDMVIHTNYDVISSSISSENGYFVIEYESAGTATSYVMTKITSLLPTLDLSYYDNYVIRAKNNASSSTKHTFYLYHTTYGVLSASGSAVDFGNVWEVIETDVLQSIDISELYFVCRQQATIATSFKVEIDFIKLIHGDGQLTVYENGEMKIDSSASSPESYTLSDSVGIHYVSAVFELDGYDTIIYDFSYTVEGFNVIIDNFYLSDSWVNTVFKTNYDGNYTVYEDDVEIGNGEYSADILTTISSPRNTSSQTSITYTVKFVSEFDDIEYFYGQYQNPQNDEVCTIFFYDQEGRYIPSETFLIYVDNYRRYGDSFVWQDIDSTVNLTITDVFGHSVYSNASFTYERFTAIILTFYSVKIQNQQSLPIYLSMESNGQNYTSWVFPYEVEEFRLLGAEYNLTILYCDTPDAAFDEVATNGTSVSYIYTVSSDTALVVTGETIADVFGNLAAFGDQLDSINASISEDLTTVDLYISNVNETIGDQIIDVTIVIENVDSNIGSLLLNVSADITNLNTTIYSQTVSILSELANLNTTIYDQTVTILSEISNTNTTLYAQTVDILSDILNMNTTIYQQTVDILTEIDLMNSTIVAEVLENQEIIAELELYNAMYGGVYYSISTNTGVGLSWETAIVKVNGTRVYRPSQDYELGTFLNITVYSYGNVLLYNTTLNVTARHDVTLLVPYFEQIFTNNQSVDILVYYHTGTISWTFVLPAQVSITIGMFSGTYDFRCVPLNETGYADANFVTYYHPKSYYDVDVGSSTPVTLGVTEDKVKVDSESSTVDESNWGTIMILGISLAGIFVIAATSLLVTSIKAFLLGSISGLLNFFGFDARFEPEEALEHMDDFVFGTIDAAQKRKKGEEAVSPTSAILFTREHNPDNIDWKKVRADMKKKQAQTQSKKKKQGKVRIS